MIVAMKLNLQNKLQPKHFSYILASDLVYKSGKLRSIMFFRLAKYRTSNQLAIF